MRCLGPTVKLSVRSFIVAGPETTKALLSHGVNPRTWFCESVSPQHARFAFSQGCDRSSYVGALDKPMKRRLQFALFLLLAVSAFGHTSERTLFLYLDAANRLTNITTPLSRVTSQGWNNRGLLQTVIEPSTNTANFYYDARGRPTNRTDGVGTTYYRYDANNNLSTVSEGTRTNTWGFDAYDRVTAFTNADGSVIRYGYDANGNVTGLTYPGNRTVHYAYDSLNRLTNVTDWADRQTSFEYDLASRLKKIIRPNGTVREINYDDAGQTTSIVEKTGGGLPLAYFKLNWNDAARVEWEFAAPLPHAYTPPTRTMTYDDDNRIATFNGNNVTYDLDGNLTSGPGTNNTFISYTYDARNRLVGTLSTASVTYGYDPAGNRVGLTNGANVTRFVINPNAALSQVLMRINTGVTNYYIYGLGLLYEVTETASSTTTLTYHYDYRGSTIALTDGTGNVTDRIEYSAYGTTTYRMGTADTPFLFNGRYGVTTDPNGLLYLRARYYNPYLCCFLNPDPIGFSGGLNFYAYADGNPISLIDPFGLYGNPVSGSDGPVGPSSPYAPGGAFYVPTPLPPPGPVAYFVGGAVVGAGVAAAVVFAAPVAVSGLVAVGVPATTASAAVTTGVGVAAVGGAVATGVNTYNAVQANDWNAVAFNAGGVVGGLAVGVGGGGRAMAEGIMGRPSPAPNTWNPITVAQYEWSARLRLDYPDGSIPAWMASAPTPASGGASAAFTAGGVGSFLPTFGTPNSQQSQGSWITPSFSFGSSGQSSSTGK